MKSIAVFCGSSMGNDPMIVREAYNLGRLLALNDISLVYGGSKLGIMGKVAEGALDSKGEVIGVIPEFLKKKEVVHNSLTTLHTTKNMHERKLLLNELSEGIVTLPGGFGTMEEMFELVTWAQLGLHSKPLGILNVNGYYDELLQLFRSMMQKGFLKKENYDLLLVDTNAEGLLTKMFNFQPQMVEKWIKKDQL